jgi:cyclic pyranopterin phosphate synthase
MPRVGITAGRRDPWRNPPTSVAVEANSFVPGSEAAPPARGGRCLCPIAPISMGLVPRDSFNREIDYLRISVIDRCNLRCVYCMPLEGLRFLPNPEMLTAQEIELVVRAAIDAGFRKFRLTGGEPTLRADLVEIVERVSRVAGVEGLALTTNALMLPELARPLKDAGLTRINVHLDSLDPATVERQMRWGSFERIWSGIMAAEAAGLTPIKLNAVVAAGFNESDVVELARLTIERDWHVRFIELMPLGGGECATLSVKRYVSNIETRRRIESVLGPLAEIPTENLADESRNYRLAGARGIVGFISPVSEPYCGTCNRMRLTADGKFHLCLLNDDELDVRRALRSGSDGALGEVTRILRRAVELKPTGHHLFEGRSTKDRSMYQIGG